MSVREANWGVKHWPGRSHGGDMETDLEEGRQGTLWRSWEGII